MSSSAGVPPNPTSHNVASLLPKLNDPDPDIRYMTLNDLHSMLENGAPTFLSHDYTTCARVVDGLIHTLNDGNGDVQNMAINCLGPFVNRAPESILCPTIEKVSNIKTDNTIDTTVPALAVRAIVVALPHPVPGGSRSGKVQEAYSAISRALIPRLVGKVLVPLAGGKNNPPPPKGMLQDDLEKANDSNSLDLLAEVAKCFGPMLQEVEVQALEQIAMEILQDSRCGSVMKKKAVAALAALGPYFSDALLASHISYTIEQLRQPHLTNQQRKIFITIYGSMAKSVPQKFGPYLKTLAPFVLSPLSQMELDQQREQEAESDGERDTEIEEVREAALVAIENFLQACATDLKAHLGDVISASMRFLKYDPALADDEDEEMEEEQDEDDEFEVDEDFEEETGFEDEDDVSWKVRRCSAKVLHALIATLNPPFIQDVAPALIARFKEREESVRNEVIATLAFLISKNGPTNMPKNSIAEANGIPQSRKRRRGGSDAVLSDLHAQRVLMNGYASPSTPPPMDKASEILANINPLVVTEAAKLLKTSTGSTKLAVMSLLKVMVSVQRGGLSEQSDLVIEPVVESMKTDAGSASGNALRIEALRLLRVIGENHSSKILQAHLNKIIPALVAAAKDRYAKVASEAFSTIEVFVKALTPPRSAANNAQNRDFLGQLYEIITERINAQDTDTEVRQKAVHALGLLVGRASGSTGANLLSEQQRFAGQDLIAERMKNELTRLASVRAVDTIAVLAQSPQDFKPGFVANVAVELGAQLRKSSRSLRGASLSALRMLAVNQASRQSLDDETISRIVEILLPLIKADDLHMLGPALAILGSFAKEKPFLVTSPAVISAICEVTSASLHGNALEALVSCVEVIGQSGAGKDLMASLLNQGVQANTDVSGRVIGTLLVSSGSDIGVQLGDFLKELNSQTDEGKKCLALSVLGEAGLRQGTACSLKPENFTPYFEVQSEKVKLAAAVALGRAGAGNVKLYLPQILKAMAKGRQYLLLHSVKELLQHSAAEEDIRPYTSTLWEHIISSGQAEDNKVVSAECIGRLATIDPAVYLPQLQTYLENPNPTVRGMVITALRYIFSDTDDSYNVYLQSSIIQMLTTMLADGDLENQRLSLSAFNSAFHNKPDLVTPQLSELLPYAMQATVIRPDLVREVAMGPFKHKVDDGLEIRKSAFETLYALLDEPASRQRLDISSFYDRIIAGVGDEHEIKILCCLVLSKLITIAPSESARRLESLAQQFRAVLAFKPKDNAVKQELEKLAEHNKAIIRVSVSFNKAFSGGEESRAWKDYFEWVRKENPQMLKASEEELKRD
jgi:cullin-associated NEDD8-dissociated protein 1